MKQNSMRNSIIAIAIHAHRLKLSSLSLKNGNISKKDLLTRKMEMRFVILALPEYPEACLMIVKFFVCFDLRNYHCAPPAISEVENTRSRILKQGRIHGIRCVLACTAQWSFWRSECTKNLAIIKHTFGYSERARMTNLISIFFVNRS